MRKCKKVEQLVGASNVSRKYSWSQTADTTCRNAPNVLFGHSCSPVLPLLLQSPLVFPFFVSLFFGFCFSLCVFGFNFSTRWNLTLEMEPGPNAKTGNCLGATLTHTHTHTHSQRILNFNYQKIVFMCDLLQSVGCAKLLNVLPQSLLLLLLLWLLFLQLLLL